MSTPAKKKNPKGHVASSSSQKKGRISHNRAVVHAKSGKMESVYLEMESTPKKRKESNNEERINLRVQTLSKELIDEGARLSGMASSSAFIISAAVAKAKEVIMQSREVELIRLSNRDFDYMMKKIEDAKGPNEKMIEAMKKFKKSGL